MYRQRATIKTVLRLVFHFACAGLLSACAFIATSSSHTNKKSVETTKPRAANQSKILQNLPKKLVVIKPLFGVDIQIVFSIQIGSNWTNQKIKFSPISPASTGTLHGQDTLSIPITGGSLKYQTFPPTASGTFVGSGGFTLSQEIKLMEVIRNIKFDLAKHVVLASINNRANQELFDLRGISNVSINQAKQLTLRKIALFAPNHVNETFRNYFQPHEPIGIATITISTTSSDSVGRNRQ